MSISQSAIRYLRILSQLVIFLMLASCVQSTTESTATTANTSTEPGIEKSASSVKISNFSAITSKSPYFKPSAFSKFAWLDEIIVADKNSVTKVSPELQKFIKDNIEKELESFNFKIAPSISAADYILGTVIVLDKSDINPQLNKLIQSFPTLGTFMQYQEAGSLVMGIARPGDIGSQRFSWQGAIKAFEPGEMTSAEIQEARLQVYIKRLMASIPPENTN